MVAVTPIGPVLVATKLRAPPLRPEVVVRSELVERLVAGSSCKLALVCAPAGWGKSTLLAEWAASPQETRSFAWLSLDVADHDPIRFWSYVLAAFRELRPELGSSIVTALPSAGPDLVDVVVAPLINELAALEEPLVLVLDDYHLVRSEPVHESVAYLLRQLPAGFQLAIATRADPPLPVASLRAAGQVLELRATDLRFSEAEAEAFLNGALGVGLDPGDVELLRARTEGWAAGLQLAALSARGVEDRHAFVEELSGSDRMIGDYLRELLADQPPALRDFLLQTSILERMCAPLCDAVTQNADAQSCLDQLYRSNLFLVPLDAQHRWYRYHHLFGDLLRDELVRREPALVPELHRRASDWHQSEGNADEAIIHAAASGDERAAAELIAEYWRGFLWTPGEEATVARWVDALSPEAIRADVRLCLARGWAALVMGRPGEAGVWLEAAESCPPAPGPLYGSRSVESGLRRLRAEHALLSGDVGRTMDACRSELALAEASAMQQALARVTLGAALYFAGEPVEAEEALVAGLAGLPDERRAVRRAAGLGYAAIISAEAGEPVKAERLLAEAEDLISTCSLGEVSWTAPVHHARGILWELRGDRERAASSFERQVVLARRGGVPLDLASALLALARLERRRDPVAARTHAREARAVLASCPDPGRLSQLLAETERALQLAPARRPGPELPADPELSERELVVLRLLASDLSQREIGSELYVSLNTVKGHARSIFRKLGVSSRADAVARGRELSLI